MQKYVIIIAKSRKELFSLFMKQNSDDSAAPYHSKKIKNSENLKKFKNRQVLNKKFLMIIAVNLNCKKGFFEL